MKDHRRKFSSKFKSKVVLEAISNRESLTELAVKFELDRNLITGWKKKFIAKAYLVFELDDIPSKTKKVSTAKNKKKVMSENIFTPFDPINN